MPKKRSGITKDEIRNTWMIHTSFTTPDGEVLYIKKRGFKTERDAFEYLEILKEQKIQEFESKKRYLSWVDATDDYWNYFKNKVKATTSANLYPVYNAKVIKPFKDKSVEEVVDSKNLRAFKKSIADANFSSDYINRVLRLMRLTIEYLYRRAIVKADEFNLANIELEPVTTKEEIKKESVVWSRKQFAKFIDTFDDDDKYKVMFEVFGHLGCRVSELRGLQVKHFDYKKRDIHICQQVTSKLHNGSWQITSPKTSKSTRHVTVSDRIANLLYMFIKDTGYKSEQFIFFGDNPVGESTIRRIMDEHTKEARLPKMKIHGIRHSNATWLLNNPNLTIAEIGKISERLGHESKKVTLDIYYHLVKNIDDKNILSALL